MSDLRSAKAERRFVLRGRGRLEQWPRCRSRFVWHSSPAAETGLARVCQRATRDRFSRQRLSAFASSRERLRALCSSGRRVARGLDIRHPQPRPVWRVSISVRPFLSIAVIRFRQQPGTASHGCSSGKRYFFQRSRARLHSLTPGFVLGGRGRLAPGPL